MTKEQRSGADRDVKKEQLQQQMHDAISRIVALEEQSGIILKQTLHSMKCSDIEMIMRVLTSFNVCDHHTMCKLLVQCNSLSFTACGEEDVVNDAGKRHSNTEVNEQAANGSVALTSEPGLSADQEGRIAALESKLAELLAVSGMEALAEQAGIPLQSQKRLVHGMDALDFEAVRAEDLNSFLGRLVKLKCLFR